MQELWKAASSETAVKCLTRQSGHGGQRQDPVVCCIMAWKIAGCDFTVTASGVPHRGIRKQR